MVLENSKSEVLANKEISEVRNTSGGFASKNSWHSLQRGGHTVLARFGGGHSCAVSLTWDE